MRLYPVLLRVVLDLIGWCRLMAAGGGSGTRGAGRCTVCEGIGSCDRIGGECRSAQDSRAGLLGVTFG